MQNRMFWVLFVAGRKSIRRAIVQVEKISLSCMGVIHDGAFFKVDRGKRGLKLLLEFECVIR